MLAIGLAIRHSSEHYRRNEGVAMSRIRSLESCRVGGQSRSTPNVGRMMSM